MAASDQETQSFANLPWWDLWQDEERCKRIRIALAENKALGGGWSPLDIAQQQPGRKPGSRGQVVPAAGAVPADRG
ncbi:MAG: hypothetical protein JSR62_03825 [Nitrospira sp.]|nr:hypothetical protein [Nitrospira sp.]